MRRIVFVLTVMTIVLATSTASLVQAETTTTTLDVVISELAWMGTNDSFNNEWLELYNNTDTAIDLTGWNLTAADSTPSISLSGTIPAHGYFLLERSDDDSVPGVTADMTYTGALGNEGESLTLRDGTAVIIDQVDCSSGWFAGHNEGRVPMKRVEIATSGNASNWTHNPRCGDATNSAGISHTCTLTTTNVGSDLSYAVYFNDLATTATEVTTASTSMETALLDVIDNATTRVDIALYGLNRQSVVNALIAAHTRGVTVRVVGDDDAANNEYSSSYQALVNAGVTVITDTSSYIQHNKFAVIDGTIVWTGSTNFTDTGFTLNANNSIVITDTHLSAIYTTEFDEMWAGQFHNDKHDNTPHLLDYNSTLVESYFSPTDLVAFEVWDELLQAETTLHFAMFFWTDELLTQRTIEMLEGTEVSGIWDQLGAASATSADEALCAAGAHIKFEDLPGKVHHKFAVIDVEGNDPTVILGSYNWTGSGAYGNDENTLIIHDRTLARAYYNEWKQLWDALGTDNMCNPVAEVFDVTIAGPDTGQLNTNYTFTATVTPSTTVYFPLNYTWQATNAAPVYQQSTGLTATVAFSWTTPSPQAVTVTVTNTQGTISSWHNITISPPSTQYVYLPLVNRHWPPYPNTPSINGINNTDGDGEYPVSWTELPDRLADTYVLQEATDIAFTTGLRTVCTTAGQSCSVSGKVAGTYYYRVKGANVWGESAWSNAQPATVLPPATPLLNAIDNSDGDGDYTVTWNAVALASSYTLQEDTALDFSSPITVSEGAALSWSATAKTAGNYYYRVRASGPTGQSGWSTTQSVSVLPPGAPYLSPIDNSDGDGNYAITWGTVSGATSYALEEDDNAAFSSPQTLYTGPNLAWSVTNHAYGTYYYRVRASGPSGQSAWSNTQTAAVLAPANIKITFIEYNPPGDDVQGEYVRIENQGGRAQTMTSWTLRDVANHIFTFPSFTLAAGGTVRVWTKSGTNTTTDLYWGSGAAIWNNTGDTAYLRDGSGALISEYTYP